MPLKKKSVMPYYDKYTGASYKVLTGVLNQTGTNVPTLSVLNNTIETGYVLSRVDTGRYRITFNNPILLPFKYWIVTQAVSRTGVLIGLNAMTPSYIEIQTMNGGSLEDGALFSNAIEIRVYE